MASAGLKRLGLEERIREIISDEISLPSPGQGALGIECLADDKETIEAVSFINDEKTRACCLAERAVSRALDGSCQVPLAAYATIDGETMRLRALIGDHTTGELASAERLGSWHDSQKLAAQVVEDLLKQGARRYIEKLIGKSEVTK